MRIGGRIWQAATLEAQSEPRPQWLEHDVAFPTAIAQNANIAPLCEFHTHLTELLTLSPLGLSQAHQYVFQGALILSAT
jgi:hypothetical protein